MSKELLTATRMSNMLACPRRHYWRFEVGLKRVEVGDALRFGSAWHRAMEARATGANIEAALAAGLGTVRDLDEVQVATLSGMLAGYWSKYPADAMTIIPEVAFNYPLPGSRTFDVAGKIDGLATLADGRVALVEHKTAGTDIGPDSDYWIRLRGNPQIAQYVLAARCLGWDVATVIYDVARKPEITPRAFVPRLDEQGLKIVLGSDDGRVMKRDGEPKQTADKEKGERLAGAPETPEQFGDRLAADTRERPDFYFARREVPILEDELSEFQASRLSLSRMILGCRAQAKIADRPEHGWPRNIGEMSCRLCDYSGFCLQGIRVDAGTCPAGFVIGEKNPELVAP